MATTLAVVSQSQVSVVRFNGHAVGLDLIESSHAAPDAVGTCSINEQKRVERSCVSFALRCDSERHSATVL